MDEELQKIINRLKNLKQNKELPEGDILAKAQEEYNKKNIISSLSFCIDDNDREFAKNLIDKYLSQSSFESEADRDTLRQLIDLEILAERIKQHLKKEYDKANPSLPTLMMKELRETESLIIEIKEKLGLSNQDRKQDNLSETLSSLKKKALQYYSEHRGCNIVKCPYCQKIFYLLLRTDLLTPEKCSWFKGTSLYNRPLMELIQKGTITQEQAAEILGVNILYVNKIFQNIYLKEKLDDR
jgi:hypothetical protein